MMTHLTLFIAFGLTITTAMLSGLFFVFSNFAMAAFSKMQPTAGVSAMQSINTTILNPGFIGLFMGTTAVSLLAAVLSVVNWSPAISGWLLAGALLYLIGCFVVTAAFNVPLNNQLEAVQVADVATAEAAWKHYFTRWQPWNHLRTVTTFLSAGAFLMAALRISAS